VVREVAQSVTRHSSLRALGHPSSSKAGIARRGNAHSRTGSPADLADDGKCHIWHYFSRVAAGRSIIIAKSSRMFLFRTRRQAGAPEPRRRRSRACEPGLRRTIPRSRSASARPVLATPSARQRWRGRRGVRGQRAACGQRKAGRAARSTCAPLRRGGLCACSPWCARSARPVGRRHVPVPVKTRFKLYRLGSSELRRMQLLHDQKAAGWGLEQVAVARSVPTFQDPREAKKEKTIV
jgi:hypothetical protein